MYCKLKHNLLKLIKPITDDMPESEKDYVAIRNFCIHVIIQNEADIEFLKSEVKKRDDDIDILKKRMDSLQVGR